MVILFFSWLIELDKQLLIFVNRWGEYISWMDAPMVFITQKHSWGLCFYLPLAIWLIARSMISFKWNATRAFFLIFCGMFAFASGDYVSSGLLKPFFGRSRPCMDESIAPLLRMISTCDDGFSFTSTHATTAFSLAAFLSFSFREDKWLRYILFANAILVSFSRLYLGVHYPGDLLIGAIVGLLVGYLAYWIVFLDGKTRFQRISKN
ncbi:MAG: phosphatase PAP2 family protein [Cytophagales bacterium]|nr:phosphatase PAP2 family protein [Cytophagales bacterium]